MARTCAAKPLQFLASGEAKKKKKNPTNLQLPANFGREEMRLSHVVDSSLKDELIPPAARRGMSRPKTSRGPLFELLFCVSAGAHHVRLPVPLQGREVADGAVLRLCQRVSHSRARQRRLRRL